MKPGWKTTEFWLTLITQILGLLQLTGVIKPEEAGPLSQGTGQIIGGLMTVGPAIGYAVSRGIAKLKAPSAGTAALLALLLLPAFPLFTAPAQAAVGDWIQANQVTLEWGAVTKDFDGNPLPATEIQYRTLYVNETDTAKAAPLTVGITTGTSQVFTFQGEGRFILGVQVERVKNSQTVGVSPISWSDNPAACKDQHTFGVSRYVAPAAAGGLVLKTQ